MSPDQPGKPTATWGVTGWLLAIWTGAIGAIVLALTATSGDGAGIIEQAFWFIVWAPVAGALWLARVIARGRQRPTAPPPGWMPDPSGHARMRWWDGTRWTDHTS